VIFFFITIYFYVLFDIAVVCWVLEAQYNPAPSPIPDITDSAIAVNQLPLILIKVKTCSYSFLVFND
jgi:hypothetical protein